MEACQYCGKALDIDANCPRCEAVEVERQDAMRDERLDEEAAEDNKEPHD